MNRLAYLYSRIAFLAHAAEYSVEIHNKSTGDSKTYVVRAATLDDAIELAKIEALKDVNSDHDGGKDYLHDALELLGIEGKETNRGFKHYAKKVFVWKDPVYRRSYQSARQASSLKHGSFIKSATQSLTRTRQQEIPEKIITDANIKKATNLYIISLFSWLSVTAFGALSVYIFFVKNDQTSWIYALPYAAAAFVGLTAGPIGFYQSLRSLSIINSSQDASPSSNSDVDLDA